MVGHGARSASQPLANRYETTESAFREAESTVLRLYEPVFDPEGFMDLQSDRVTWIIAADGYVVFEDCSTMKSLHSQLKRAIDEHLTSPLPPLSKIDFSPKSKDSANSSRTRERLRSALVKMNTEYDDVEEIYWIKDRYSPSRIDRSGVFVYIGIGERGGPWLRFRIQYSADDWLFIESCVFKVDESRYEYFIGSSKVSREAYYGGVAEWFDTSYGPQEERIALALTNANEVKLRYQGQQFRYDRVLSTSELRAISNVLEVFDALAVACQQGIDLSEFGL